MSKNNLFSTGKAVELLGIAYFDYSQEELADEFRMLGMLFSHGEDL